MSARKLQMIECPDAINKHVAQIQSWINDDIKRGRPVPNGYFHSIERLQTFLNVEYPKSQIEPLQLGDYLGFLEMSCHLDVSDWNCDVWLYQNMLFGVKGSYTESEKRLLILEEIDKERQKFERLKAKFSGDRALEAAYIRERIPEEVRIAVWRRDQGKCSRCGSREKLEYDHIIPVTRGGSNTVRNIELLCETCNRAKGDRIV